MPLSPASIAFVRATMSAPTGGRADLTLTAVGTDGAEQRVGTWSEIVGESDRVVLSRSPAGDRAAFALGRMLRTVHLTTGETVASRAIGGSEPSVVIAWTPGGIAVARDTDAPSGPDLPLEDGWTLHLEGAVEQDHGFHGGHTGGSMGLAWPLGTPEEQMLTDVAAARAAELARFEQAPKVRFRLTLERGGHVAVVADDRQRPADGTTTLYWPPIVGPAGVVLRRTASFSEISEPESPTDVGAGSRTEVLPPWLVRPDGSVSSIPVELAVSPLCALPDGALVLPGASELWRDDAEEPMHLLRPDGTMEPLLIGGAPVSPGRMLAAVAPDLLPTEPRPPRIWENDEGLWVQAARRSADGNSLIVLLAEAGWPAGPGAPEAAQWLVVSLPLGADGDGRPSLVARGVRPEGTDVAVAL